MLPDMSDVLSEWEQDVLRKVVDRQTVDFEPVDVVTAYTMRAVVQVERPENLNMDTLDWSRRYIKIHTNDDSLNVGEFLEYQGQDYKIVTDSDFSDYGFYRAIGEQTKEALLVPDEVDP